MRHIILSFVLSVFTFIAIGTNPHTDHIKVDTEKSVVKWKGSKVTESHVGNISITKGILMIEHGKLRGGEFSIDMTSIENTDMEGRRKERLEWHLKNEDFFDVENFPTSTLSITKVLPIKEVDKGDYLVIANLTIKGITNSVTFYADLDGSGLNYVAKANIKIDRTKWNVNYNSGNFFKDLGDKLILNELEFEVSLSTGK